jgi:hypothetical protein
MLKEPVVIHATFNSSNSTIELSRAIDLKGYGVGVLHVSGFLKNWDWKSEALYLCGDVCQDSYLNNVMHPILCPLSKGAGGGAVLDVTNPVWLKLIRERITSVRLYVVNAKGEMKSFDDSFLKCTLVFIPHFNTQ